MQYFEKQKVKLLENHAVIPKPQINPTENSVDLVTSALRLASPVGAKTYDSTSISTKQKSRTHFSPSRPAAEPRVGAHSPKLAQHFPISRPSPRTKSTVRTDIKESISIQEHTQEQKRVVGGVLEYVGEVIENAKLNKHKEKKNLFKLHEEDILKENADFFNQLARCRDEFWRGLDQLNISFEGGDGEEGEGNTLTNDNFRSWLNTILDEQKEELNRELNSDTIAQDHETEFGTEITRILSLSAQLAHEVTVRGILLERSKTDEQRVDEHIKRHQKDILRQKLRTAAALEQSKLLDIESGKLTKLNEEASERAIIQVQAMFRGYVTRCKLLAALQTFENFKETIRTQLTKLRLFSCVINGCFSQTSTTAASVTPLLLCGICRKVLKKPTIKVDSETQCCEECVLAQAIKIQEHSNEDTTEIPQIPSQAVSEFIESYEDHIHTWREVGFRLNTFIRNLDTWNSWQNDQLPYLESDAELDKELLSWCKLFIREQVLID